MTTITYTYIAAKSGPRLWMLVDGGLDCEGGYSLTPCYGLDMSMCIHVYYEQAPTNYAPFFPAYLAPGIMLLSTASLFNMLVGRTH